MSMPRNILVVGLGSLAKKLICDIARASQQRLRFVVLSRSQTALTWCQTHALAYNIDIVFERGDAMNADFLQRCIDHHEPSLILQCASLLDPFCLHEHPLAAVSRQAGFALMLPAQLAVVAKLMQVVNMICPQTPVVNCSFPDVVNPILQRIGYAPVCGIGNAGIIEHIAKRFIGNRQLETEAAQNDHEIEVFAHHIHAIALLKSYAVADLPDPIIYINGQRQHWQDVIGQPSNSVFSLPLSGEEINAITSASATKAITTLLDPSARCQVSLPGPRGQAGGWPVIIEQGKLQLKSYSHQHQISMREYFSHCARLDGVENIREDGTVEFSENYIRHISPISPELCRPLKFDQIEKRFQVLQSIIRAKYV